MNRYYLAYGSNLNMTQMSYRCPNARLVGKTMLQGYELLFKGSKTGSYLTIEPKEDGEVPIGIWEISKEDERHLDIYEGYPNFYYKVEMPIDYVCFHSDRERKTTAFIYIMHEDHLLGLPSTAYLRTCTEGYANFGFDTKYLFEAYNRTERGMSANEISN